MLLTILLLLPSLTIGAVASLEGFEKLEERLELRLRDMETRMQDKKRAGGEDETQRRKTRKRKEGARSQE